MTLITSEEKGAIRYRAIPWADTNEHSKELYGVQASRERGVWMNCAEGGIPLIFEAGQAGEALMGGIVNSLKNGTFKLDDYKEHLEEEIRKQL